MKLKLPYIQQHYTGHNIGGFLDTYQRTAGIMNIVQYVSMIIILYTTSAQPWFATHFPWITFPVYMTVTFATIVAIMVIAYIIIAPSHYAFWNQQIWKHDNPLRTNVERIEENQKRIMEKLGIEYKE